MTEKRHIHDVEGLNARLQAITRRAKVDLRYLHDDRSRQHIVEATRDSARILDIGAGMRDHLGALGDRVETLDLNDIDAEGENLTRPDILGDVCQPFPDWMEARYDAVIALAILEHVYDPAAAVANFRRALKPGGPRPARADVSGLPAPQPRRHGVSAARFRRRHPVSAAGQILRHPEHV
jgi:2-polyprenyl-3-methyl-5-hydroxy-6-metoxy-1,4-benzoquinol methylase